MMNAMGKDIKTSSWGSGKYDLFFYGLARGLRPKKAVELGTFAGYSAYCIGLGIEHNKNNGRLDCYDLWEDYKYNHVSKAEAERNLKGLPVSLYREDYTTVHSHYRSGMVDLLMVDLSNNGDIYKFILDKWYDRLSPHAVVLMEGGTEERDNWSWMVKFKKTPISTALNDPWVKENYKFDVLLPFPGITIFTKKQKHLIEEPTLLED